ncbi:MAG TPA: serine protein kinase RIO [Nanoarchaeota archaeon]|nr:serine protein kinase RIO [Nanoarchaeota archaeon]
MAEQKEATRPERFKAFSHVFDEGTLRAVFKVASTGQFEALLSPIKIGKEANLFTAKKGEDWRCVKVYRIASNFKKMFEYMAPDPRYAGLKRNKMSIINTWAIKEYRNLLRARENEVRVPTPYYVFKNVLVMEFIGHNEPSPQLNNKAPEDPEAFYEMLISNIRTLYQKARLVHADLSQFNVLNYDEKPVIIDFSHAIDLRYPNATQMLERDIRIMCDYFRKLGLKKDYKEEVGKVIAK